MSPKMLMFIFFLAKKVLPKIQKKEKVQIDDLIPGLKVLGIDINDETSLRAGLGTVIQDLYYAGALSAAGINMNQDDVDTLKDAIMAAPDVDSMIAALSTVFMGVSYA